MPILYHKKGADARIKVRNPPAAAAARPRLQDRRPAAGPAHRFRAAGVCRSPHRWPAGRCPRLYTGPGGRRSPAAGSGAGQPAAAPRTSHASPAARQSTAAAASSARYTPRGLICLFCIIIPPCTVSMAAMTDKNTESCEFCVRYCTFAAVLWYNPFYSIVHFRVTA